MVSAAVDTDVSTAFTAVKANKLGLYCMQFVIGISRIKMHSVRD
jgi:hypothetical protein